MPLHKQPFLDKESRASNDEPHLRQTRPPCILHEEQAPWSRPTTQREARHAYSSTSATVLLGTTRPQCTIEEAEFLLNIACECTCRTKTPKTASRRPMIADMKPLSVVTDHATKAPSSQPMESRTVSSPDCCTGNTSNEERFFET